ncbi:kinase domain-containing protein [Xylaria digitata]|nr:kinase domain-containing protein [Xylaria digitata]
MQPLSYHGSTSDFYRYAEGNPNHESLEKENVKALDIERQILETLSRHPRIVPYLGFTTEGIYLSEARLGNLQTYVDSHNAELRPFQRVEMCKQVAEAIVYAHGKGVIHSDLRPENFLVDQVNESSISIWLCDFESTLATDIFSLGSIFYTIQTGYWPFRDSPPRWNSMEEKEGYETQVDDWFKMGCFPSVSHMIGGDVIKGCWDHQYNTADEVLEAVQAKMIAPTL